MTDVKFFLKTLAVTLLFVLLLQIPVEQTKTGQVKTLETATMSWVQTSFIATSLHGVSRGAATFVHDLSHKVSDSIHHNVNRNKKGDSDLKKESPFSWTHSSKPSSASED